MIAISLLVIGTIVGAVVAKRRKGNRLDILQYAGVYAIIFAIVGVFLTIMVERMI